VARRLVAVGQPEVFALVDRYRAPSWPPRSTTTPCSAPPRSCLACRPPTAPPRPHPRSAPRSDC